MWIEIWAEYPFFRLFLPKQPQSKEAALAK